MQVPYSYLQLQLAPGTELHEKIIDEWKQELARGLFTLGPAVERLEEAWAKVTGSRHAIAVNSGTDGLIIALRALGIHRGKMVLTAPNSFVATVGAIVATGATPVFADVGPNYLMNAKQIDRMGELLMPDAVIPVDLTGNPVQLESSVQNVVRDACQSIGASIDGISSGREAKLGVYSLHPLKNVHATNDGGMIVTDDDGLAKWIRLYRNHGLMDRDHVDIPGINSRLDTIGAIAAYHILQQLNWITEQRNQNAALYDKGLEEVEQVALPPRPGPHVRQVFHTYVILVERRQDLQQYLSAQGIDTKVHYPIPIHLQAGYEYLGYKRGDFPVVEYQAEHQLSLPIHEYLMPEQIEYVCKSIQKFYR